VDLLVRVAWEHEQYQASVDEFQLWLKAVVEKVHSCLGRKCKLTTTLRLSALQVSPHVPATGSQGSAEAVPQAAVHLAGQDSVGVM
jgi:hypothetical protein